MLLNDADERTALRQRGAEHVRRYTWDASAHALMTTLRGMGTGVPSEAPGAALPQLR